jgi:hypothetical protein
MSPSDELAHLGKLLDMSQELKRSGVVNAFIPSGVLAALTYGATSNLLLSITVGFGVVLIIGVGQRVVADILSIEVSRTTNFFSGTEEELNSFLELYKRQARILKIWR